MPEDILTGFVDKDGDALGRPVDVAVSIGPARRWSPAMSATPSGASRPVQPYLKWLRGQHQSFDRFRSLFSVSAEQRLVNMVGLGIWPGRLLCIFPPG
jgi:hypothetical protein